MSRPTLHIPANRPGLVLKRGVFMPQRVQGKRLVLLRPARLNAPVEPPTGTPTFDSTSHLFDSTAWTFDQA